MTLIDYNFMLVGVLVSTFILLHDVCVESGRQRRLFHNFESFRQFIGKNSLVENLSLSPRSGAAEGVAGKGTSYFGCPATYLSIYR